MLSASTQVRIRDGKAADAAALGAIFRESWTQAYRGIIPHLHLETMIRRRGAAVVYAIFIAYFALYSRHNLVAAAPGEEAHI